MFPGNKFVLSATKGGPTVEEWPRTIFQEPN